VAEQIVAFKTEDGQVFTDQAAAAEHETRLVALREVASLLRASEVLRSSFDVSDLAEFMVTHRATFVAALEGQVVEPPEEDQMSSDDDAAVEAQLASLEEHHQELVEDEDGAPLPPDQQPGEAGPSTDDDIPF
jgi:hypothetical protein